MARHNDLMGRTGGPGTVYGQPFHPPAIVGLATTDFKLIVSGLLTRPVTPPVPKPRYVTIDRPGAFGLTEFNGMDPYEMTLPIRFDGAPHRSVEHQMAGLEKLAERQPDTLEPPIITIDGPVPHPKLRWRITGLEVDDAQTMLTKSGRRCRIAVDVHLMQHVADDLLTASLKPTKRAKGIANHATRVRSGEDSVYDVARRVYGDPSRGSDIARANNLRLATRLKVGTTLMYP